MGLEKYKFSRLGRALTARAKGARKKRMPKTMSIFMGYFFMLNFCVGTGFLGIPYSFFYSGHLAGIPTLFLIGFVSWLNANWLLECMARAQAVESHRKRTQPPTDSDTTDTTDSERDDQKGGEGERQAFALDVSRHPKFEITISRKFETLELCEIFFNRWVKYLYLAVTVIYSFTACWSFATVAGSAWAVNIPLNFGSSEQCDDTAFHHHLLPAGGCLFAYYFSLFLFGLVVITLSLLDLKEQALVQVFLGMLRFITVAAIVVYSIVKLAEGGEVCEREWNEANISNLSLVEDVGIKDVVLKFNTKGWLTSIPVLTYAFFLHSGIPSVTHPLKQKSYLHWLISAMFLSAGACYLSLGVVVPLWFKASVQEIITLNFGAFTTPGNHVLLRIFAYNIILFPSIDVMSAYSLNVHVMVNNLYILITGRDTSRKPKYKYDFLIRISLRLVSSVLPLLAAFGIANLIFVLKYAGLFSFLICFIFTTALQLKSTYVCMQRFQFSSSHSHSSVSDSHTSIASEPDHKGSALCDLDNLKQSLKDYLGRDKQPLYMTPYSNAVLSHPILVTTVGAIGVCLLILSITSLFVHVDKMSCFSSLYNNSLRVDL